ncbi:hypothetical protein UNSWDHB_513 [Dehalobacter sp. UNSWDHB]|jgi:hypothetical protein|uniref:hypothetical protein n=1 Tax=unclassified Dehalobacter TaxID=2635733 RepID=UPI00028B26DA|nr:MULTISPECIES: hypothetical protein [unclassified Dehalobacter]AFV03500.1 hypothetical protein DHBDCA_p2473 [Dehalobacter sp. DCA]AFV06485.1 hypothetical protein DCF50_p2482 [Dehalobacter sp. CF]EQB22168.1 hypothetical protein UNSWDHB_513 [Dehalobacter sp. UNSWDHB]
MRHLLDFVYIYLCVVLVIFIGLTLLRLYSFMDPLQLMAKGDYAQAIEKMKKTMNTSAYKRNPKLKNPMVYNIANCHNRAGDLHRSLAVLDEIKLEDIKDNKLLYCYHCLYAINLLLLEQELENAGEMLDKARELYDNNELQPLLALRESCRGDFQAALKYVRNYQPPQSKKKKTVLSLKETTLIYDAFILEVENNYFIGLTYLKAGKQELAAPYLQKAAAWKIKNYYSAKAREALGEEAS